MLIHRFAIRTIVFVLLFLFLPSPAPARDPVDVIISNSSQNHGFGKPLRQGIYVKVGQPDPQIYGEMAQSPLPSEDQPGLRGICYEDGAPGDYKNYDRDYNDFCFVTILLDHAWEGSRRFVTSEDLASFLWQHGADYSDTLEWLDNLFEREGKDLDCPRQCTDAFTQRVTDRLATSTCVIRPDLSYSDPTEFEEEICVRGECSVPFTWEECAQTCGEANFEVGGTYCCLSEFVHLQICLAEFEREWEASPDGDSFAKKMEARIWWCSRQKHYYVRCGRKHGIWEFRERCEQRLDECMANCCGGYCDDDVYAFEMGAKCGGIVLTDWQRPHCFARFHESVTELLGPEAGPTEALPLYGTLEFPESFPTWDR